MAFVNFNGAKAPIDMTGFGTVDFGRTIQSAPNFWSWLTWTGNDVDLTGSGLQLDSNGRALAGRISKVEIDLDDDDAANPDIRITGLNVVASPLDDSEAALWNTVLAGNDIIDATALGPLSIGGQRRSTIFGDDSDAATGTSSTAISDRGGNDVITLGVGRYIASGDVDEVAGSPSEGIFAVYQGGRDQLLGNSVGQFQDVVGDAFAVRSNAKVFGGDDLLQFAHEGRSVGDVFQLDGAASGPSAVIGGNDRLEARVNSNATITGDVHLLVDAATVDGGDDDIKDSDLGNEIAGDVFDDRSLGLNRITGRDDEIFGNGGDDVIAGDVMLSVAPDIVGGDDVILGGAGNDKIFGELGRIIKGGVNGGNDELSGDAGDDTILGQTGNDKLFGGADNDRLEGGVGNDVLDGGTGNDALVGGAGHDVFVFGLLSGFDRVLDFQNGQDKFDMAADADFGDLDISAVDAEGNGQVNDVRIELFEQVVLVLNRGTGLFDASDFLF